MDEVSTAARIAGACNAILLREDGVLVGDMFDGGGFVRGMMRKGRNPAGARAVVGNGGAGSAVAASLARAGVSALGLFDVNASATSSLVERLQSHFPKLEIQPVL
jgi:shikimate dehydrogenase